MNHWKMTVTADPTIAPKKACSTGQRYVPSHCVATVAIVANSEMLPQRGRVVLVVLQDGRQLEGELHTMTDGFEVGGVVFEPWQIDELEDVT